MNKEQMIEDLKYYYLEIQYYDTEMYYYNLGKYDLTRKYLKEMYGLTDRELNRISKEALIKWKEENLYE